MPTFDYTFTVKAPLTAVSEFHHDANVLKTLSPPPIVAQIHHVEPMAEGSIAEFTLWFGPLPLRWTAVHQNVSDNGFTDVQAAGPLRRWEHTHRFTAVADDVTEVHEHIEYEHESGPRGLLSRLLFAKPNLTLLFTARRLITRYHLETTPQTRQRLHPAAGAAALLLATAVIFKKLSPRMRQSKSDYRLPTAEHRD